MSKLYLVNWSGPFDFDAAKDQKHNGIYLVFGRKRLGPNPSEFLPMYVGKAFRKGGVGSRLREHDNREFDHPNNSWWTARIHAPDDHTDTDVRNVEAMLIWGVDPACNEKGTYNPPKVSACVINQWYFPDGETRRTNNIDTMAYVPDVLTWDRSIWRVADRLVRPWWER